MNPIARSNSLVVDPGAWGYRTTQDRDSVDQGSEFAPRFWNTCADLDQAQSRLTVAPALDQIKWIDFKLFNSSLECESQWLLLEQWLQQDHERVLHIVNDGAQGTDSHNNRLWVDYAQFERLAELHIPSSVHLDCTARINHLDQERTACATVERQFAGKGRSFVINIVWHKMCYVHIHQHPLYARGERIVTTY